MAGFTDGWETRQEKLFLTKMKEDEVRKEETKVKTAKLLRALDKKAMLEYKWEHQGGYCPKCFCLRTIGGKCMNGCDEE